MLEAYQINPRKKSFKLFYDWMYTNLADRELLFSQQKATYL